MPAITAGAQVRRIGAQEHKARKRDQAERQQQAEHARA
jgi:hypothetical protein